MKLPTSRKNIVLNYFEEPILPGLNNFNKIEVSISAPKVPLIKILMADVGELEIVEEDEPGAVSVDDVSFVATLVSSAAESVAPEPGFVVDRLGDKVALIPASGQVENDDESSDSDWMSDDEGPADQTKRVPKPQFVANGLDSDDEEVGPESLRTKNELGLPVVQEFSEPLDDNIAIEPLGVVHAIVDKYVIVQSTVHRASALDMDSLLCFANRKILGRVFETLGPVAQPLYSVLFNTTDKIDRSEITKGAQVFYAPSMSHFVFPEALKALKGSDASNFFDEEVDDNEREFSDDEQEMEFKKMQKLQKRHGNNSQPSTPRDSDMDGLQDAPINQLLSASSPRDHRRPRRGRGAHRGRGGPRPPNAYPQGEEYGSSYHPLARSTFNHHRPEWQQPRQFAQPQGVPMPASPVGYPPHSLNGDSRHLPFDQRTQWQQSNNSYNPMFTDNFAPANYNPTMHTFSPQRPSSSYPQPSHHDFAPSHNPTFDQGFQPQNAFYSGPQQMQVSNNHDHNANALFGGYNPQPNMPFPSFSLGHQHIPPPPPPPPTMYNLPQPINRGVGHGIGRP